MNKLTAPWRNVYLWKSQRYDFTYAIIAPQVNGHFGSRFPSCGGDRGCLVRQSANWFLVSIHFNFSVPGPEPSLTKLRKYPLSTLRRLSRLFFVLLTESIKLLLSVKAICGIWVFRSSLKSWKIRNPVSVISIHAIVSADKVLRTTRRNFRDCQIIEA